MLEVNQMNLQNFSNALLTESFREVAIRERHATATLIAHIREFSKRRLYLEEGCSSIFAFMTQKLGYSEPTAQNRIDAARFVDSVPAMLGHLYSGQITLTQISVLAQSVRQKENESLGERISDQKKIELVEKICGLDTKASAVIIARELDLTLKTRERLRYQKDESVVLEITLSKEQIAQLRRIRELASHQAHDANWADTISLAAAFYLEKKDPRTDESTKRGVKRARRQNGFAHRNLEKPAAKLQRTAIPKSIQRKILNRDECCQQVDPATGKKCGSTYQLQIDHIRPIWSGGGNEIENLQVLCGVHNRYKYSSGH